MFKTTHVGSLPRPMHVCDVLQAREEKGDAPANFNTVVGSTINQIESSL